MVVEHLAEPTQQFREVARILKPDGRFLFHTPNRSGYPTILARMVPDAVRGLGARLIEGRSPEDRFPTFYRANTPAKIEEIAGEAGFTVERCELLRSSATMPLVAPLAVAELLLLRSLANPRLDWLRPNLIVTLRREVSAHATVNSSVPASAQN
jgi:SAM-dependent methyltransferase